MHGLNKLNGSLSAAPKGRVSGGLGFTVMWIGQVFSLFGTSMTAFALAIWAFQVTPVAEQATILAFLGVASAAPLVISFPLAGVLVDRWNRRKVIIVSDFCAGLPTVVILLLHSAGNLQVWHLYVANAVAAVFQAFHFPAFSAAATLMLPKRHYGRASGMVSLAQFLAWMLAPATAAVLLSFANIYWVLIVDIISFMTAILMISAAFIPQPPTSNLGQRAIGGFWKQSIFGFRYIFRRSSLLGLQLVFCLSNVTASFCRALWTPLILRATNSDNIVLGSVSSVMGLGGLLGSLTLMIWGGSRVKIHSALIGIVTASLGAMVVSLGQTPHLWALGSFVTMFSMPTINGSSQAIWQAKVEPDLQGRVFSARFLMSAISAPAGMAVAGPLADCVFEPAMMPDGILAPAFAWLVGTGPSAGIALLCFFATIIGIMSALIGYAVRTIRDVEKLVPDFDSETSSHGDEPT